MRVLISFLLLGSCLTVHNIVAYAEERSPITDSVPEVQPNIEKDIFPAIDGNPRPNQTGKEWESYLADIGKFRIDLALDGFKLHNIFVQGNTAFSIIYQFYLGEDYHPKDIDLILGEKQLDNSDAARACLSKWTLSGFLPNKKYLLILSWEHVKGYKTLTITGDEMSLQIRLRALV